ncbi:MAG: carboxylate-amine ligase [Sphingobacteriia bacterium]|nr:MAG: carboxylate-amine ligase [Sphingobacteriia bacterium]
MQQPVWSADDLRLSFEDKTDSFNSINDPIVLEQFKFLQTRFSKEYDQVFADMLAPKTVVVIPSLTLDQQILSKVKGFIHYEERLLCMLILLRMPNTHLIYVTSVPIDPIIIDYYLHLLPGITSYHAQQRLTLLSCYDYSSISLTEKILARPRLIDRIKKVMPQQHIGHISCFNETAYERKLATLLNLPIYGTDPDLLYLGTKSGGRKLFKECRIETPIGIENVKNEEELRNALLLLKKQIPNLKKAVIKMNDGFSGEGNAVFSYAGFPGHEYAEEWMASVIHTQLSIVAEDLSYNAFMKKFTELEGIVEVFIEGETKTSPSVQCRITPKGIVEIISTHDQVLGGHGDQVFLGASFPASLAYSKEIAELAFPIAQRMSDLGVLGRFSIDFISVLENDVWKHYAIEINLRKGGTTHPYLILQFLTDGKYDYQTGAYTTINGQERFYFSTDNLTDPSFIGLTPHDLMTIANFHNLMYDSTNQIGVMFHLIGALSQFGKLGIVCIGNSPQQAIDLYQFTNDVLKREGHDQKMHK